jgi:uncharacterized Zn finger protein
MTVEEVGPGQYRVESGPNVYWVDLASPKYHDAQCDCPWGTWHGECKHLKAVRQWKANEEKAR